jgi:hypothetical protein
VFHGVIVKNCGRPQASLSPSSRGSTRQRPYIDVSAIEEPATASAASRVRVPLLDVLLVALGHGRAVSRAVP